MCVPRITAREARTFIHLSDDDRAFARWFLRTGSDRPAGVTVGFQPGTSPSMRWKQWPIERYREVIRSVISAHPDSHIVLFGSPLEEEMIYEMARGLKGRISIAAGKTSVKQVAALIEKWDLLVCNASGLMPAAVAGGSAGVGMPGP